mgnify:CR=1 FL=1
MAASRTSLSAGELLREILLDDAEVARLSRGRVYPIVSEKPTTLLPYITYRRASLEQQPVKGPSVPADRVNIEIVCYAKTYAESITLAEAVRAALDDKQGCNDAGDLQMRSCYLADSEEDWVADAYAQALIFNVKI